MDNLKLDEPDEVQNEEVLKEVLNIDEKYEWEFTKEVETSIRNVASSCYKKSAYLHRHMDFEDVKSELTEIWWTENKKNGFANMAHINWFLKKRSVSIGVKQRNDNSIEISQLDQYFDGESEINPEVGYQISINYNNCESGEDNMVVKEMISKLSGRAKIYAVIVGYLRAGIECLREEFLEVVSSMPDEFAELEEFTEFRLDQIRNSDDVVRIFLPDDIIFKVVFKLAGVYSSAAAKIKNETKSVLLEYANGTI